MFLRILRAIGAALATILPTWRTTLPNAFRFAAHAFIGVIIADGAGLLDASTWEHAAAAGIVAGLTIVDDALTNRDTG